MVVIVLVGMEIILVGDGEEDIAAKSRRRRKKKKKERKVEVEVYSRQVDIVTLKPRTWKQG